MPKLKTITQEEMSALVEQCVDISESARDLTSRIEKGYATAADHTMASHDLMLINGAIASLAAFSHKMLAYHAMKEDIADLKVRLRSQIDAQATE